MPVNVDKIRMNIYNLTYVNFIEFKSTEGESKQNQVIHDISGTWTEFILNPGERIIGVFGSYFTNHSSELLKSLGFIIEK